MIQREKPFVVLSFIIVCLGFTACMQVEDVPMDLSNTQPKLVVHCILSSNDEVIKLKLSKTVPSNKLDSFDKEDIKVPNAYVFIRNLNSGQGVVLNHYNDTLSEYSVLAQDFNFNKGDSLELTIDASGFNQVSAKTLVPIDASKWESTNIKNAQFEFSRGQIFEGVYAMPSSKTTPIVCHTTKNAYLDNPHRYEENLTFDYVSFAANKHKVVIESLSPIVSVKLITPCENLYQFLVLEEFYRNNDLWSDGGSFESIYNGILPEYTNVENGLGVFGAYLEQTITYD